MTIIAVGNQKGGVGKTTTALTLGHGLALRGYSVLLVDTDPQGHQAVCLGMDKAGDLADWLRGRVSLKQAPQYTGRDHLALIRSDGSTADYKVELAGRRFREQVLIKAMDGYQYTYDVAIIDCAPSRDVLLDAAIMAAHYLLVPGKMDQLSADGLSEILSTLHELRDFGSHCELMAVIPTMYDRRESESLTQLDALVSGLGSRVWPTILTDSKVKVAARMGRTLWELKPSPRALAGYTAVLDHLEGLI